MSALPSGWAETTIGSLCDLVNGKAFKPSDWTERGLPIVRIQNLNRPEAKFNHYDGPVEDRFLIESGDLLFAWSGTPGTSFGAHIWNGPKAVLNQHIFNVRYDTTAVDRAFFRYAINQTLDEQIAKAHGGVGLRHVTKGKFEETAIALPPLPEQRRIVAKIDSLTGKSRRARDHLDHIPRLVEKYKQAVLAAAFRGDLTREWRVDNPAPPGRLLEDQLLSMRLQIDVAARKRPVVFDLSGSEELQELPFSWAWMPVSALATKVVDGVHSKPDYVEQGVPFLTVKNLTAGPGVSFEGCRFISEHDHQEFIKRTAPEYGDILITKDGTLGVVRAVRSTREFSIFVSLALVKPVDRSMTDYLELAFQSPVLQEQMTGVGSGLQHIHLTDLRKDFVPVAPPDERDEIVKRVRTAMTWIDRLASEATSARKLIDCLDQAVLAKAFRGELVPQDPTDEPASTLLERIKAERGDARKQKRRGKG